LSILKPSTAFVVPSKELHGAHKSSTIHDGVLKTPLLPLKVGLLVYCRGKLSRIESIEEFGEHHGWLLNNDGDRYLVPQSHPDLQDVVLRVAAELDRSDFDF
jgi:hypothetical protein